jgi:UDP-glucose 4-epimerase
MGTLNLLEAMRKARVNRFIFSSTAAIYGNPVRERIDENRPKLLLIHMDTAN